MIAYEALLLTLTLIPMPTKADYLSLVNVSIKLFDLTLTKNEIRGSAYATELAKMQFAKLMCIMSNMSKDALDAIYGSQVYIKFVETYRLSFDHTSLFEDRTAAVGRGGRVDNLLQPQGALPSDSRSSSLGRHSIFPPVSEGSIGAIIPPSHKP